MATFPATAIDGPELYLELLKKCLTRSVFGEEFHLVDDPRQGPASLLGHVYRPIRKLLARRNLVLVQRVDQAQREQGMNVWPTSAETMLGQARLDNVQQCVEAVLRDDVPGDLLEAGVWRGGAAILMRGVLAAHGDTERTVWVADSFRGLPPPDPERYPADAGDSHWTFPQLAIPVEEVQGNFARYGLRDERVRFLEGWFKDTLRDAPIERLSVLRIDADMYESTMDALAALYAKVSVGGYVIIDDYLNEGLSGCRQAVDDFRAAYGSTEEIHAVDWTAAYWRKQR
jgi:O-methyltransferase